jgi:hypothetical protein
VRTFNGGDELEDCVLHGTSGFCLNGNKGKEVIEVVNDLFAQEEEKGGEVCTINSSIMEIHSVEALEIESVCKVDEESKLILFVTEKGKENVFSGYGYRRRRVDRYGVSLTGKEGVEIRGDRTRKDVVGGNCRVVLTMLGAKASDLEGLKIVVNNKEEILVRTGPKAWRVKKEKPTLTLGQDIGMLEVEALSAKGLVGRFGYWAMEGLDIDDWVAEKWGPVLGYLLVVYILTRGWYCFVFKQSEDVELVLKSVWVVNQGSLMLKH